MNTSAGPVVAWLDTSSGHANVYVRQFNGTTWVGAGQRRGQRHGSFRFLDERPRIFARDERQQSSAIAWTQPGTSAGNSIYLKQNSGSGWAALSGLGLGHGHQRINVREHAEHRLPEQLRSSPPGRRSSAARPISRPPPTTARRGRPVSIDTPTSAGPGQVSRGAASHPVLSSNGGSLELAWVEDRLIGTTNQAVAIYADQLTGGSFVRQLAGDASFDGILHRSTSPVRAPRRSR